MECAMILSDINGCNELVTDGTDGLLVPAKNKELLLEKMLQLRTTPEIKDLFAAASRKKIMQHYNRSEVWNHLLQEYKTLLTSKQYS